MAQPQWMVSLEKDVEIGAKDLWDIFQREQKAAPQQLAALGLLAQAIDKAVADGTAQAANPAQLVISIPSDIADIKAIWTEAKAALATFGIKS